MWCCGTAPTFPRAAAETLSLMTIGTRMARCDGGTPRRVVIKDKVSAAVYVDAVAKDAPKLDPASVELLVFTTGLLIDTLSIRKKTPAPSLSEPAGPAAVAPAMPPEPPGASATVAISALRADAAVETF